jgi:hypothetical protein
MVMPEIKPIGCDEDDEAMAVGHGSASLTATDPEYTPAVMADFRAHALALRAEGATHVGVGSMSVQFEPRERALPAGFAEAVKEAAAKADATPASDEDYVP